MPRRGFTLIELLVVVAIIGLLASIIVASLQSARTKANYAAAKQLDSNFSHNLGDSLVGQWLMDEGLPNCTGNVTGTVADSSGFGRDGAPSAVAPVWSTNTPFGTGCSVYFSTTPQYIDNSSFSIGASTFTMSLWIKQTSISGWRTMLATPAFRFSVVSATQVSWGWVSGGGADINYTAVLNKWQHILITKSGTLATLYVNGVAVGTTSISNTSTITGLRIGMDGVSLIGGTDQFLGNIDNVRIYDRALDIAEVQKLYVQEAPRHGIAFVGSAPWSLGNE